MRIQFVAAGIVAVLLSACVTTQEMPLAPNVVRLDTNARGLLFVNQAPEATMKRAAEVTLEKGFTHFRFDQADMSQGSQLVGMTSNTYGNANFNRTGYGSGYGTYSGFTTTTPIMAPTSHVGVTVIMFRASEPGAQGAFDAQQVLKDIAAKKK